MYKLFRKYIIRLITIFSMVSMPPYAYGSSQYKSLDDYIAASSTKKSQDGNSIEIIPYITSIKKVFIDLNKSTTNENYCYIHIYNEKETNRIELSSKNLQSTSITNLYIDSKPYNIKTFADNGTYGWIYYNPNNHDELIIDVEQYYGGYGHIRGWQKNFGTSCVVNIITEDFHNPEDMPIAEPINLGLSVKWASWNMGASKIADYGGLYGAGDPTGQKTSTNPSDYYFKDGESICGTKYDLAHVKWGGPWRMPTFEELLELRDKCTWEHNVTIDGVNGSRAIGPNGNSIFIPYAGAINDTGLHDKDYRGSLFSGDMGTSKYESGYQDLDILSTGRFQTDGCRNWCHQSIRPVYSENTSTKRTIHVATAGTLPNLISESEKYTIEELTLTGELNGTDFRLLRDMAGGGFSYSYDYGMFYDASNGKLTHLDISDAKIVSGGDAYIAYYDKGQDPKWNEDGEPRYYYLNSSDMIPECLFWNCKLTSVILPNSLVSMGYAAFMECSNLASITIPNSVTSIGNYAFNRCTGLTTITIPNSVTTIGFYAFYGCTSLASITIPNSVTSIGECAFYDCKGLTSITIPNSVTSIGERAFQNCSGLMSIKVEIENKMYDSRNSCNAIIETSSNKLIMGCNNTIIPNTVKSIGNYAFYGCCDISSISIPNSVTTIGNCAFSGCSGLTTITIPNSVTTIGVYAFNNCSGLTSITIPNSVTSIGNSAFSGCKALASVNSLIEAPFEISSSTFSTYDDATLYVPKGTKQKYLATRFWYLFSKIDDGTEHNYDKVREVFVSIAGTLSNYISESEKYYIEKLILKGELNGADFRLLRDMAGNNDLGKETGGRLCYLDMSEARIVHGGGNYLNSRSIWYDGGGISDIGILHTSIEKDDEFSDLIFAGCMSLKEVVLPQSVISIGYDSFWFCGNLESVVIPNSLTSIGDAAFGYCRNLTSITIPNSVMRIGDDAFEGCSGLTSISISNSVTSIGNRAFCYCSGLTSISIPNSVTSIGDGAFGYCSGLTSISIPNSVTRIGDDAFCYCSGLTSISIPNSVTSIGISTFSNCSGLTSISIPNSVKSIGNSAFRDCRGLTSISIPNSVTNIGNYAFWGCSGLTSISIPNSVTSIGNSAFSNCSGLTSISIPNSVTSIGNSAFSNCSGLTSISIPNSVTSIGDCAFSYCSGLKDIISEIKTPFEIKENVFSVYSTATLTVPNGTKAAYQSTAGWNKFTNIVEKDADIIILGDANGDSEVNVSDIVEVVNYIMNKTSSNFLKANADLNGDGEVNVTDIVMMVSIIMSGQTGSARTMSNRAGSMKDSDCLMIDDVSMNAGETKQVSISLNNPDKKYTAFQFDLTLPEGITIAKNSNGKLMASLDTERKDDHTLSVSELGNNTYRFLAFSMSNAELYGTNGPLVNITLEADANMDSGTNAAALKSQVFTATDGTQYKWSDLPFSIQVNGSENTDIDEISQNGQKGGMIKVYTLTGLLIFYVSQSEFSEKWQQLPSGVYIVNGQKMIRSDDSK